MTCATNYDDVLGQLRAAGLQVDGLEVGRLTRCRVEGDRERRGWYILHEFQPDASGDLLLVGSFGIWHGAEKNAQRIELRKQALTADQKSAIRARITEDRKRAEAQRKRDAERAARRAENAWRKYGPNWTADPATPDITSDTNPYLQRKCVRGHGVRFTPAGNLVVPIGDADGRIHGLQVIYNRKKKGRDKDYWPAGLVKRGHFHLIGTPQHLVLISEGFATGASAHEATGLPVAIAFDANNLQPVAQAIKKRYRDARILILADDDFATWGNPGITCASAAALAVGGEWLAPRFNADPLRDAVGVEVAVNDPKDQAEWKSLLTPIITGRQKLTDWNDLHVAEGLHLVRAQIEAKLAELEWRPNSAAPTRQPGEVGESETDFGFNLDVLRDEYALIYGTETVFDARRRRIIGLGSLRAAAGKSLVRMWLEHPNRATVLPEQVGFDPTGTDTNIICNLWGGWPTMPQAGSCERLLELLEYLCSNEDNPRDTFRWILKWLAYPIQHPGTKMQTAVLMHGPEGTGKNTFFGVIRKIYEGYGGIFSQTELESQFNGWASGKLFMIGNEVVTRVELYHQQGRLKNMVTEPEWQVNEKNLPTRMEANHCNFVFFSNRIDIAKLDPRDRRYCVVWTPEAVGDDFYREVAEEIRDGGIAALHDYLLNLDVSDFHAHTKPPSTRAKRELIELSMDSTERFWRDWTAGELDAPCVPCLTLDLYRLYQAWGKAEGVPKLAQRNTLIGTVGKKNGVDTGVHGHYTSDLCPPAGRKTSRVLIPPEQHIAPKYQYREGEEKAKWITRGIFALKESIDGGQTA